MKTKIKGGRKPTNKAVVEMELTEWSKPLYDGPLSGSIAAFSKLQDVKHVEDDYIKDWEEYQMEQAWREWEKEENAKWLEAFERASGDLSDCHDYLESYYNDYEL